MKSIFKYQMCFFHGGKKRFMETLTLAKNLKLILVNFPTVFTKKIYLLEEKNVLKLMSKLCF